MQDRTQGVFDYIEKHRQDLIEFLCRLVEFDTTNPGDGIHGNEKPMQEYLAGEMKKDSFDEIRSLAFDEERRRPNLVGLVKGSGGGKSVCFNGHCDVVPVAFPERWLSPPFAPRVTEDKIFGRGTSDMKGGLAGAYFAVRALKACGVKLKGDLYFASCVGEESQSADTCGTGKLVTEGKLKADFAVTCEPSDLEVHVASPALVFFKLIVEGKGVHVSARNQMLFPQVYGVPSGDEIAVDAFEKSLPLVDFVRRFEVELNHRFRHRVIGSGGIGGRDKQGVGVFTINPSRIEGGEYLGSVPARMEYTYAVWYPDQLISRDQLIAEIRAGISSIANADSWLKEHPPVVEAPVIQDWPGFSVDPEHPGVTALRESAALASGGNSVVSAFKAVCDAYYLNKYGIPSVVLGPGSIFNSVHGDNEFIFIDDLIRSAKIYAAFAMKWCGV